MSRSSFVKLYTASTVLAKGLSCYVAKKITATLVKI